LAHPERVAALILVDAAVYIGNHSPRWLGSIFSTPQMRRLGPLFTRQIVALGPRLIELAWHNSALLPPEMLELYRKPFQVENWDRALWELTRASQPSGLADHLDKITLPALVVTGDDDRIVPTRDSIRLAGELPNASLVVIENAGHIPQEEKPQVFMQEVTRFLNRILAEQNSET
jgi:pimeloyl-ACP methyl ester carboxylesterase